eukprot:scaffold33295_cov63-Phaeocystis_antarctica.AAC.2
MENIGGYLDACRKYGVPAQDNFLTVDLFEGKNMNAVVRNLHSLGRVAQQQGFSGPTLGARLATTNRRSFTAEQMAQVPRRAAASATLFCTRLQPPPRRVAASSAPGCSLHCTRRQAKATPSRWTNRGGHDGVAEAAPGANVNTGRREVAGPSKDAIHSSPRAAPNEELLDGASPGRRRSSVQSGESHAGAGEGEEDRAAARVAERVERARAARQTQREESHTVRTLRQERDEWQQRSIIAEAALALHQAPKPEHATCLVQTDEVECVEVGALEDEQERRHVAEEEAAGLRRRLQQSEQAERGNTEQLEARAIKGATAQLEAHAAELAEARAAQVEQLEQASLLEAARAEVTAARRQAEELAAARAALGAMEVHSLRTSDDLTATSAALAAAEARAAELQRSVAARSAAGGGAFHARGRRRFDAQASTTATPQQSTGAEAQAEGAEGAEAE